MIHVVEAGDSIWNISQRYGVSPQRIITDNALWELPYLIVGQALQISIPEVIYTVRPGDTLISIAQQFGLSVYTLLQRNPDLDLIRPLTPGQTITIRFRGAPLGVVSINGYAYPFINRTLLRRTLPFLTDLTLFGYGFTEYGTLIPINDQPLINLAYQYNTAPILLLSSITESGNFSGARARSLFCNPQLQNQVISQIIAFMKEKGYLGIDIDFEYIEPEDADAFLSFLRNITDQMHAEGFRVNVDLAPKTSSQQRGLLYEAHNYAAIGAIVDTVLLMTYEWGYAYGPPLAVAPLDKVRQVVAYAVTQIPVEKIMMGIPNYGYDWTLPFAPGNPPAPSIGNQEALLIAARYGAQIQFDETAQSPFFEYYDERGRVHIVWFEDVRSIRAKYALILEFGLRGSGYWNIMRPFAQNWAYVGEHFIMRKLV